MNSLFLELGLKFVVTVGEGVFCAGFSKCKCSLSLHKLFIYLNMFLVFQQYLNRAQFEYHRVAVATV